MINGISVVIPNYNGAVLLPQVLPTVEKALRKMTMPWEIIVVDDCSTDGTIEVLQDRFPSVLVLRNEINSGFSITSNKGVRAAKFDWVLLLNSDVKLDEGYFAPLLKYAERPAVFGVMGRIIGWDDEEIQDGAKYPYFHGVKIKTSGNYLLKDPAQMKEGILSMYLSGANAFFNRSVFLELKGFNEMFSPFYVEDFELSLRAWRLGYSCYYEHAAVCRHKTSVTIVGGNRKKYIRTIYNRNKMFLHAIHLQQPRRMLWFLQMLLESIGQMIRLKFSYLESVALFVKNYGGVKRSRQQLGEVAGSRELLSVGEVVEKINQFIKGKDTIRF
jgi:GT2 family glycosyltransferase